MSIDAVRRYTPNKLNIQAIISWKFRTPSALRKPRICCITPSSKPIDCMLNLKIAIRYYDIIRPVIFRWMLNELRRNTRVIQKVSSNGLLIYIYIYYKPCILPFDVHIVDYFST
jgi:hypothetical protein